MFDQRRSCCTTILFPILWLREAGFFFFSVCSQIAAACPGCMRGNKDTHRTHCCIVSQVPRALGSLPSSHFSKMSFLVCCATSKRTWKEWSYYLLMDAEIPMCIFNVISGAKRRQKETNHENMQK